MALVSVEVTEEMKKQKSNDNTTWAGLIKAGFRVYSMTAKLAVMEEEKSKLNEEIEELTAQLARKGAILARYIEKYGADENLLFPKRV